MVPPAEGLEALGPVVVFVADVIDVGCGLPARCAVVLGSASVSVAVEDAGA
jgi:hypothetical protein